MQLEALTTALNVIYTNYTYIFYTDVFTNNLIKITTATTIRCDNWD